MPRELHDALEKRAQEKGLTGESKKRFVFGTMAKRKKKSNKKAVTMDHAAAALSAKMRY